MLQPWLNDDNTGHDVHCGRRGIGFVFVDAAGGGGGGDDVLCVSVMVNGVLSVMVNGVLSVMVNAVNTFVHSC